MAGVPWCFFNTTNLPEGIADEERVNCIPEGGFSPNKCTDRGCSFANVENPSAPMCYFDNEKYGYKMVGEASATAGGYTVMLKRMESGSLFGKDVDDLQLDVTFDSNSRLHIKFFDPNNDRFEVPLPIEDLDEDNSNPLYDIQFFNEPTFYFKVIRKSSGAVLLDTSLGGFTFSDQFIQFSTKLESTTMYGWGEHEHQTFKHDFNWMTYGMYSRDQPPYKGANLYGVHPFYVSIEQDNSAHGVLFLNSAAQDVTLTPAPGMVYKTIGGVLDMYVFLGPEPNSVIEQYTKSIGSFYLVPYWSLGFQLCRYGYNHIDVVKDTVARMDAYQIPYDVQYGDIDYMDEQRDFTYDHDKYSGLPQFVDEMRASGKHYVIILDPCLTMDDPVGTYAPYEEGLAKGVYIMEADGVTPLAGKVWPPGQSAFPDFTNPVTHEWWKDQCKSFHDVINYDGLWIDMNEPANFVTGSTSGCTDNELNIPPYKPAIWGDILADKSVCPDAKTHIGNHYDTHSLFGWSQSNATYYALEASTGKRPFVISRSTFPGSGRWAAHWLGDNNADWHNLKMSIIGMLEFNLFGIPFIGADICGFNGNTGEELCQRWMEVGSFYPFSRNHNGIGYQEQDPAAFGDLFAQRSKEVLEIRYTLLPYLYTLFYDAHVKGSAVVRSLAFEFVSDTTTHDIDEQFMWGSGLMFSPVLESGVSSVTSYFPAARWYNYLTNQEQTKTGTQVSLDAPLGTIPIHIRGGTVIPTQKSDVNTEKSRHHPHGLIIALDADQQASGRLYWDGLDTVDPLSTGDYALFEFDARNNKMSTSMTGSSSIASQMKLGTIKIFGASSSASVRVNGKTVSSSKSGAAIIVEGINESMSSSLTIEW